ncbi:MAG: hypothetical protein ACK5O1_01745 [Holosporales bacterium]
MFLVECSWAYCHADREPDSPQRPHWRLPVDRFVGHQELPCYEQPPQRPRLVSRARHFRPQHRRLPRHGRSRRPRSHCPARSLRRPAVQAGGQYSMAEHRRQRETRTPPKHLRRLGFPHHDRAPPRSVAGLYRRHRVNDGRLGLGDNLSTK